MMIDIIYTIPIFAICLTVITIILFIVLYRIIIKINSCQEGLTYLLNHINKIMTYQLSTEFMVVNLSQQAIKQYEKIEQLANELNKQRVYLRLSSMSVKDSQLDIRDIPVVDIYFLKDSELEVDPHISTPDHSQIYYNAFSFIIQNNWKVDSNNLKQITDEFNNWCKISISGDS